MQTIQLTQGKVAIIDDCDSEWLSQWKWHYAKSKGYACKERRFPVRKMLYMHREILQRVLRHKDFAETDHINRDKLDNRRCNLRPATSSQNKANVKHVPGISGYQGVYWDKGRRKWSARIRANGKRLSLGYFDDVKEAARVRNEAARKYHGEFAVLNEIKE